MAENRPGGRLDRVPTEHRGAHLKRGDFGSTPPTRFKEGQEITQTLQEGRLIRVMWANDAMFVDLPAPKGTVVTWRAGGKPRITTHSQRPDELWRHVDSLRVTDPRLKEGHIAWARDEHGKFTIPVMHPDFLEKQREITEQTNLENPTLGLE